MRLKLSDVAHDIPSLIFDQLRKSRYYAENSDSIVIQADSSRKQSDNVEDCHKKLNDLIFDSGKSVVKAETSPEQIKRIKKLYVSTLFGGIYHS